MQDFLDSTLIKWKEAILIPAQDDTQSIRNLKGSLISKWRASLEKRLLTKFVFMRTKEMFSIFSEFPSSIDAISDFKLALDRTNLHKQFVEKIKEEIR